MRTTTTRDHVEEPGHEYTNGHGDVPVALLPQRNPGASGISDIPAVARRAGDGTPAGRMACRGFLAGGLDAGAYRRACPWGQPAAPEPDADRGPIDTSAFFASRAQVASNGAPTPPAVEEPQPPATRQPGRLLLPSHRSPSAARQPWTS